MQDIGKKQRISIKALSLWRENPRIPKRYFGKSETEIIQFFLKEKSFKIFELAKAIVEGFSYTQWGQFIVHNNDGKLRVLEGNRTLATYMLLVNPAQIHDEKIRKSFLQLKAQISIDSDYFLDCIVVEQEKDARYFLERKHLYGDHVVAWSESQRFRYQNLQGQGGMKPIIIDALMRRVDMLSIGDSVRDQLNFENGSLFSRIFGGKPARKYFGFWINDNKNLEIEDIVFEKKLTIIIHDIIVGGNQVGEVVNSRTLNLNTDIQRYLQRLSVEDYPQALAQLKRMDGPDLFSDKPDHSPNDPPPQGEHGAAPKPRRKSTERKFLIPNDCMLKIADNKIHQIYCELRKDLLLDGSKRAVPNAVAVLFRVFLELSLNYFITKNSKDISLDKQNRTLLKAKINKVTDYLEEHHFATAQELKNIRKVSSAKDHILHVDNFNDYVHDYRINPDHQTLKVQWDNLQGFFMLLWELLNNRIKN